MLTIFGSFDKTINSIHMKVITESTLVGLQNLQSLTLSYNRLTLKGDNSLFNQLSQLTQLDISGNKIERITQGKNL